MSITVTPYFDFFPLQCVDVGERLCIIYPPRDWFTGFEIFIWQLLRTGKKGPTSRDLHVQQFSEMIIQTVANKRHWLKKRAHVRLRRLTLGYNKLFYDAIHHRLMPKTQYGQKFREGFESFIEILVEVPGVAREYMAAIL